MKVYFKESLEGGREPGRTGLKPEEGRLKGRLLYSGKSPLQNKTVLYPQRKTHSSFSLVPEKESYRQRISEKLLLFPYLLFHLLPPDPTPTYT